jgi:hypothetical protein
MHFDHPATLNYLARYRIESAQAHIAEAQLRVLRGEHRLALSKRRLLIPIAGGSGAVPASRGQRTREKAMRGELPAQNGAPLSAGNASGLSCSGCEESIARPHQEYEIVFPDAATLRFHRECFVAWAAVFRPG